MRVVFTLKAQIELLRKAKIGSFTNQVGLLIASCEAKS